MDMNLRRKDLPVPPFSDTFLTENRKLAMSREMALSYYIPASLEYYRQKKLKDSGERYNIESLRAHTTTPENIAYLRELFHTQLATLRPEVPASLEAARDHFTDAAELLGFSDDSLYDANSLDELFEIWEELYWQKLLPCVENKAFFDFCMLADAWASNGFFTFVVTAGGGAAIEASYNYIVDICGAHHLLSATDPIYPWFCHELGFIYQRWRDELTVQMIEEALRAKPDGVVEIFAPAAGYLPELTHTDIEKRLGDNLNRLHIIACDSDPRNDDLFILRDHPALAACVEYHKQTELVEFSKQLLMEGKQFDLVYLKGLMSFLVQEVKPGSVGSATVPLKLGSGAMLDIGKLVGVEKMALALTRAGGQVAFDLQLKHYTMVRDAALFGWGGFGEDSKFCLLDSHDALSVISRAAELLGVQSLDVTTDDADDPVGHFVAIKK